jgi:hypothetical protein
VVKYKKNGPSYSQLQKKKIKKPTKKGEKRKQTFYEKVLAKNIGDPLIQNFDRSSDIHYYDSMNKTQHIKNLIAHNTSLEQNLRRSL